MKKKLLAVLAVPMLMAGLAGCNNKKSDDELTGTAKAVAAAEKMTFDELAEASKKEMEASNDTFKVLGLTSALQKAASQLAERYSFLKFELDADGKQVATNNVFVNNGYKDYSLLTALEAADTKYVADFALTQDERSIADYQDSGILHNFVPKDWESLGIKEKDTQPLKGIHFNKCWWTNTNFEAVTGKTLYNIWQVAGTADDADHLSKVSFQSPITEQINMSFLLSCYEEEAEQRIAAAYKDYYGKDWTASDDYTSAGDQWVKQFIATVNDKSAGGRWHSSDGTAMKETQATTDWDKGYVYFGAYSKMKDAAGKKYDIDLNNDGEISDNEKSVNAMTTVKWDREIAGFNGYFYTMDSQIVNNAKHPYTACLFARYLLEPEFYTKTIYSDKTDSGKDAEGNKIPGNQYGYYYPGEMGAFGSGSAVTTNKYDWTKDKWIEKSLNEDFEYLSKVKVAKVNSIQALIKL